MPDSFRRCRIFRGSTICARLCWSPRIIRCWELTRRASKAISGYFGALDGEGVLVRSVFGDSPAAKAGIKVGDVITSLDGERIRSASELREKLLTKRDKKEIKLGLLRNKAELTLSVELPQQKDEEEHFFLTAPTSDFRADKNARLTQMVSRASLFQEQFPCCTAAKPSG